MTEGVTKVVLTEDVFVIDALGHDLLVKGTEGEIVAENEDSLTLIVGGTTYSDIPVASTKELDAA
jgi:hypothetical protein